MNNRTSSGIEALDDISWGTHFCQYYKTKDDLLEILVPYFKAGIQNNEYCICVVSNFGVITVEELKNALAKVVPEFDRLLASKGIDIIFETEWYLEGDTFISSRSIEVLREKYKEALSKGYTGMRASGDTHWLQEKDKRDFNVYEKYLDDFIIGQRLTVLCTYPIESIGTDEILDVTNSHQFVLAKRKGKWEMIGSGVQMQAKVETKKIKEAKQRQPYKMSEMILNYGVAVLSVIVALVILFLMQSNVLGLPSASAFICAVIFSTWFGGTRPGLLAILLSGLAFDYYFIPPINSFVFDATQFPRLLFFLVPAFFVVWLTGAQRNTTESLKRARGALERTIRKLRQANIKLQEEIVERKQAEVAMRKSEDRTRLIIDTIPTMAWTVRPDGVVDYFNKRWLDYIGHSPEDAKDPLRVIHPDDLPRVTEKWKANMANGIFSEDEMRMRGIDGRYRWFLIRTAPLTDGLGNVVKWYGVSIDIEDRRQLSDALSKSEHRYLSLFQNMAEGVAYFRMFFKDDQLQDAIYVEVNQAWEDLSGLKNVVGRKLSEVLPGAIESKTPFIEKAAKVALTGQSERFESYSVYLKKWLSVSAYCPQKDHVIVVMDDITERKEAIDKLQLAYQRLSYHVENTPLAVIEFDKDLFVKRWSKRAVEIFGWNTNEALGKNVYDPDFRIIYKEDQLAVDTINEELTKGNVDWNLSFNRNYTKDGNVIYCEWYNSVLKDEQGNVLTILSLVHNVTERKRTEEKLRHVNAELHDLSSHLQNIQESERTSIAREIHDELGQQLTGIKMEVGWLYRKLPDVAALKEKGTEILSMVSELLKTVKRIAMDLRPNILDELGLTAALEWQTQEFEKRTGINAKFFVTEPNSDPDKKISTNIFRIYQEALTNIARHASATLVETILEHGDDDIRLIVKDNGQGFDFNEVRKKDSLGLVGMKERARMFHGDLVIEHNKPSGTVITLKIPKPIKV